MAFRFHITAWISLLLRPFWAVLCHLSPWNMNPWEWDQGDTVDSRPCHIPSSQHIMCKYDVFISFRGSDTRNTFVDHLYHHLIRKGIFVFKDDISLQKGEHISPQLTQAIKHSRVCIIVFSQDYASSTWCLDEMATIAESHSQFNQTVFSVFYDVDPSHVRNQNGDYQNAFSLHAQKYKHYPAKLHRWKTAMESFGRSVGWDVRNKPELAEIENIVQAVIKTLGHKFSGFAHDLIGIQPRVQELETILNLNSENDDVRVLGLWGMGGIGKTTHAAVLYDRISYQFDACCFIENVSKIYGGGGALAVQKQILHQTLEEKNLEAYSPSHISGIVRNRLHNIKVLLVLDNVDQLEQLEELAIDPKLLQVGSRMVIATRDKHILKVYGAQVVYEVPLLNDGDAREMFCKKAFKGEDQSSGCAELIPEVLKYSQHLPLAIRVLGSFLCTRDVTEWRDALARLRNSPDNKIMDVLQISVDELPYEEKEIFLHVACFFRGDREDFVKRILDACGLHPHIGIKSMIEKSLITIRNEEIHMHEMLQELGKKIVRQHYPKKPGCWSRLWLYKDVYHVLTTELESNNIEAIVLDPKEDIFKCSIKGLSKMRNLKMLILYHKNLSGSLNFLSNNLRYLLWHNYLFASLPKSFEPSYLVELNMPNSSIELLWEGSKYLPRLKRMDLSNSKNLTETPDFEGCRRLERLDFTGCTNLWQVHPSIGLLSELAFLSFQNCKNLVQLGFGHKHNLRALRVLDLSGCTKLKSTPDFHGALKLEYLDMDGCTSLSSVHPSIGARTKLRFLSLRNCTQLKDLPLRPAISRSFPLESLISLDLSFCNLLEVPSGIGELVCLERLNLQGNKFGSLPSTIRKLSCLAYLNLAHCRELQYLPDLPRKSASSVGRYFKTASGSRDHRSGLYVFDCPRVNVYFSREDEWLERLLKNPDHFRCGFDIVLPYHPSYMIGKSRAKSLLNRQTSAGQILYGDRYRGDSIKKAVSCEVDDYWLGFVFYVTFEVQNVGSPHHSSYSPLPHPFYLSFESECVEERFDMPLDLELYKIDGSKYSWTIYISREHCHFIETGAHITFKARPGLVVKEWRIGKMIKPHVDITEAMLYGRSSKRNWIISDVKKSSTNSGPKIQLPYNWLVTEKDEVENLEAKAKENNLSNLGLQIGESQ